MAVEPPRRPPQFGARSILICCILLACILAAWHLELDLEGLMPGEGGLRIAGDFFSHAFSPAISWEGEYVPSDAPNALTQALVAAWNTLVFALAAMSLALVFGLGLGFLGTTAWWAGEKVPGEAAGWICMRCLIFPFLYTFSRIFISLFRSVHELLWAVLLLAALGSSPLTGVIAIAIPYSCTLAKVFSEMLDEAPRDAAYALRAAGASPLQVFFFGLLPTALPDMSAYAFYRFECTIRASAILGFFGFQTLGYFIRASFLESHYGEVWTFLYALIGLVVLADWWSGSLRRRFLA